jgi:hypothetical protein
MLDISKPFPTLLKAVPNDCRVLVMEVRTEGVCDVHVCVFVVHVLCVLSMTCVWHAR